MILPPPPPAPLAGQRLIAGLSHAEVLPDLDFETSSDAGCVWSPEDRKWRPLPNSKVKGLSTVGAALYACHPTTVVLSLAYDLKDGGGRRRWRPGLPEPLDLFAHIRAGGLLEAWNVGFERWIWERVCVLRMGWPPVAAHQWRCAMAKARSYCLPGALGKAGEVLNLVVQKDADGKRLLDKFSSPRNPTQADHRTHILPLWTPGEVEAAALQYATEECPDYAPKTWGRAHAKWLKVLAEDHADSLRLLDYNETDIATEAEASGRIPDLDATELRYWQDDQAINHRGVAIDVAGVESCIALIEQCHERYNAEFAQITGIDAASKLQQFLGWLHAQGVHMDSLDEEAVEAALKWELPAAARRALEIRAAVGSASVKKVFAMRNMLTPEGRLHDLYLWGVARTGRPTGTGPQPTNLPKAGPPVLACGRCKHHHRPDAALCPWCGIPVPPGRKAGEWNPEAAEDALAVIHSRSLAYVEHVMGDAMAAVAGVLRGLFIAALGKRLISSDYTAIEGVVVACLAGEQWRIDAYAAGSPMYLLSAERMFGVPVAEMVAYSKENGHHHPLRQKGKGGELGLGFGGWINALRQFGVDGTDEELKDTVLKWREASPALVHLWGGQRKNWQPCMFGLEGMAILAVQNPGRWQEVVRLDGTPSGIAYLCQGDVLYCRLLSGRHIAYHRPRLVKAAEDWRGLSLSFEGWNSNPKNGAMGWQRMNTYGGRLAENCIAEGTQVLTGRGWVPIETVTPHDLVHDGVEFVTSGGTLYQGEKHCISIDGVLMTPDHKVLTYGGWQEAQENSGELVRPEIRHADRALSLGVLRAPPSMGVRVRMRLRHSESEHRCKKGYSERPNAELRLHDKGIYCKGPENPRDVFSPSICGVALYDRPLPTSFPPSVGELRGSRDYGLRRVAAVVLEFLERYGAFLPQRVRNRSTGQQRWVFPIKLPLGYLQNASPEYAPERAHRHSRGENVADGSCGTFWYRQDDALLPDPQKLEHERPIRYPRPSQQRVWDILNCGPRRRFVVRGHFGPFIVHNCVQATARDIQMNAIRRLERAGYPIVLHTYDEVVAEVPEGFGSVEGLESIMCTLPDWARGWPIKAAGGWSAIRYRKG